MMVGRDCLQVLSAMPAASVHCVADQPTLLWPEILPWRCGMIGLEPTFKEHIEKLVDVFSQCACP